MRGRPAHPLKQVIASLPVTPPTLVANITRSAVHYYAKLFGIEIVTRETPDGVQVWRVK
jgi:hypothetical protein